MLILDRKSDEKIIIKVPGSKEISFSVRLRAGYLNTFRITFDHFEGVEIYREEVYLRKCLEGLKREK
jgi:sRNA-binding carbon storage regulator CsrA